MPYVIACVVTAQLPESSEMVQMLRNSSPQSYST